MRILLFYITLILCTVNVSCRDGQYLPQVVSVYPSADTLPTNLLRIYVVFSQPMKTIGNLEKIKLIDEDGKVLQNVFFNNVHELWDKTQKQLTLILDPARVKTGIKANIDVGYALKAGKKYSLHIEHLENVDHQKMKKAFVKNIHISNADRIAPNIKSWILSFPHPHSQKAFTVSFPNMLDHYSLRQRLVITDAQNKAVPGMVSIGKEEKSWTFVPRTLWKIGDYTLWVNTRLEDPSGNNLNGLFDHPVGSLKYDKEGENLHIPFSIK